MTRFVKRERFRILLTFLAGVAVAALVMAVSSGVANVAAATRYEDLCLFTSVLRLVQQNYVEPVEEGALVRGAVRGMLAELDPHSSFLDTEAHREMQVDTRGEFHGLGIEITKRRDGFIEVVAPIEGTPAFQAGIRARDQIVAICPDRDARTTGPSPAAAPRSMTLLEAVQLMRGRKGTRSRSRSSARASTEPQPFTILRDVVKVAVRQRPPARAGLRRTSACARSRSAPSTTCEDGSRSLRKENKGIAFEGLVLDLRDNPGGLLDQAVKVADVWLADGLVVYTKGRVESQRQEFRARADGRRARAIRSSCS